VDRGYLAGAGYYGYGYGYGYNPYVFDGRFNDPRLGARFRSNRGFTEGLIPRGNHGRYTFLKGADVVPGPRVPAPATTAAAVGTSAITEVAGVRAEATAEKRKEARGSPLAS
jgi:hypothetical protein